MYILIVGAGRVGTAVARWLLETDHEIAIIDNDESRCVAIEEELGGVAVPGEGVHKRVFCLNVSVL